MSHQIASFAPENKFAGSKQGVLALEFKRWLALGIRAEA
jgi:hypothetical protein